MRKLDVTRVPKLPCAQALRVRGEILAVVVIKEGLR